MGERERGGRKGEIRTDLVRSGGGSIVVGICGTRLGTGSRQPDL
jgi:hypothetical protein